MKVRIFIEPQQGASYEQLVTMAQAVEAAGFDAFFRSDHFLTMGGDGLPGPTDAWVTLGAIARETERIRLGTLVTSATFRLPGLLAVQVAQVDAMSGGRVELGLGAGWYDGRAHGLRRAVPAPGRALRAPRGAVRHRDRAVGHAGGSTFGFDGRHYQLKDSPALPKPVQRPHPPLIVGGGGPKRTPRLAATYADEFNLPFSSLADTEAQFARVRAACEDRGRDPGTLRLSAAQVVCCGADEAEVQRRAAAIGRQADELRANGVAGTPDEVVARLAGLRRRRGADAIYLQVLDLDDLDHIAAAGEGSAAAPSPSRAGPAARRRPADPPVTLEPGRGRSPCTDRGGPMARGRDDHREPWAVRSSDARRRWARRWLGSSRRGRARRARRRGGGPRGSRGPRPTRPHGPTSCSR